MSQKIETKVIAATAGGIGGTAVYPFILWALGVSFWHASGSADKVTEALSAVPTPVSGLVLLVLTTIGTAIAGYIAPHTPRPDLGTPLASPVPPAVKLGVAAVRSPV